VTHIVVNYPLFFLSFCFELKVVDSVINFFFFSDVLAINYVHWFLFFSPRSHGILFLSQKFHNNISQINLTRYIWIWKAN